MNGPKAGGQGHQASHSVGLQGCKKIKMTWSKEWGQRTSRRIQGQQVSSMASDTWDYPPWDRCQVPSSPWIFSSSQKVQVCLQPPIHLCPRLTLLWCCSNSIFVLSKWPSFLSIFLLSMSYALLFMPRDNGGKDSPLVLTSTGPPGLFQAHHSPSPRYQGKSINVSATSFPLLEKADVITAL